MLKIFRRNDPYHINVNSVHAFFVRLSFVAAIDYKNIFTTKISRLMVNLSMVCDSVHVVHTCTVTMQKER